MYLQHPQVGRSVTCYLPQSEARDNKQIIFDTHGNMNIAIMSSLLLSTSAPPHLLLHPGHCLPRSPNRSSSTPCPTCHALALPERRLQWPHVF